MYGMVNEGIRSFIEKNHGPETWLAICEKAGLERFEFERMSSYDDAVTYNLVGAICEHTGMSAEDVLKVFGTYWVEFVSDSNFGSLLRLAGNTFVERVNGLDDMHDRILMAMPHLKPPSFELEPMGGDTYHLSYYSDRESLVPMVIGLLHGLAAETGEKISVTHITPKTATFDHDLFEVKLLA